ncbi:hypothetical protein PQX77_015318, partial [Marasmius sp. AFHP31]
MSYLPSRQEGEEHRLFVLRTPSSICYPNKAQYNILARCPLGGSRHQLRIQEEPADDQKPGDQYFE